MTDRTRLAKIAVLVASLATASTIARAHDDHAPLAEVGEPGQESSVNRTLRVDMSDAMRFSPAAVSVSKGETIKFVVVNSGRLKHEFVIGTEKALNAHAQAMKKFPDMEHTNPNMISLAAGKSGEVIWRFTHAGVVSFACLQAGHYDAGMRGTIKVTDRSIGGRRARLNDHTARSDGK
jgi:uncharacterized cupredoxin-like copper-binding protein